MMKNSFKLIMAGNTNVPATINVIIRATLELRQDNMNNELEEENLTFSQIHIFHTVQSMQSLINGTDSWQDALRHYNISSTSLIHHVTNLQDSNVERFRDMVEQLRTIINPVENANYYVDLTGGVSSIQAILAVFSYVLGIDKIYTLEVKFSDDSTIRKEQQKSFYPDLIKYIDQGDIKINYRKFPPIQNFDEFGKLNYTEVLRYRKTISHLVEELTDSLGALISSEFELNHLQASFLSGVNSRLMGEATGNLSDYHNSIYSFSASIEEITNVIIRSLKGEETKDKMLGTKLESLRSFFADKPKYFINTSILNHFTRLMAELRNEVAHSSLHTDRQEVIDIQSELSFHLALTFLKFTIKTMSAFLDEDGKLLNITEFMEPLPEREETVFYFGFDGDDTGKYLELAFRGDLEEDEAEVLKRSKLVVEAIKGIKRLICKETKNVESIIFAEGDNVLFKGIYNISLLNNIQKTYREKTGLSSSIGYGKTLRETTVAMRLAKERKGDSIVGISLN